MWCAKPSGSYNINSAEAQNNMFEIYNMLSDSFTIEAVCGILGNMGAESGWNPWRWQGDKYGLKRGYGLVQFTPANGYLNDYGVGITGYAPNLSPNGITSGANVSDGEAQTYVIKFDLAGKYLDRRSWCTYYNLTNTYPFSNYKIITDLEEATLAWLFNYEAPADRSQSVGNYRYSIAQQCYTILTGTPPPTPTPPDPPYPPTPPPVPHGGLPMPLWMYLRKF